MISAPEGLAELLGERFSIDSSFSIDDSRRMLAEQQVAFLIFIQKELAWWGCAALDEQAHINPSLKKVNYTKEAYIGRDFTLPRHRGLGLYTYGNFKRLEYLKEKGKSRAILATLKDNEPAIKAQKKLGSRVCGKMDYFRVLLLWEFWRERWDSAK